LVQNQTEKKKEKERSKESPYAAEVFTTVDA